MARSLRSPIGFVLAALALLVSACGVEAGSASLPGSGPSSSAEEPAPSSNPATQAVIDTYIELGFTPEEAECLAGAVLDMMDGTGPMDTTGIMDAVNECDIPMSKLADIGAGAGNSVEDGMRFGLETSLRNQGLSDSEASCVADEYVAEYGTDPFATQDPEALADLLAACDLTISDLGD